MIALHAYQILADSSEASSEVDPTLVTPGPVGFTVFILLVFVVVGLGWDLTRRLRRNRYREEISERLDAEEHTDSSAP